ncbi:MAG: response regulator transcription factor [Deltaproteobacteria bacterium]|nr:response regulator transcription factor [Deltaproteobacteria bacterium]
MSIKIIIADDHKIIQDGLKPMLDSQPDIEVVALAGTGRKAVELTKELKPDLVIMDISMPDLNGVEATIKIVSQCPEVKIIALSMNSDRRYIKRMFEVGVSAYLTKDCSLEELVDAIRIVSTGKKYLSPEISSIVIDESLTQSSTKFSSAYSELTIREREVLQLLAEGKSINKISAMLSLSIKTVHTHRKHIMGKLDLHSIAELTKFAIMEGLTSLDS